MYIKKIGLLAALLASLVLTSGCAELFAEEESAAGVATVTPATPATSIRQNGPRGGGGSAGWGG